MTTAQRHRPQVPVAGVLWPVYKLIALAVGLAVLLVIFAATGSAAAAVLTAAGTGTALWLVLGPRYRSRR